MKVGDKIAVRTGGLWGLEYTIRTIVRETKTLWVLDNSRKYRKYSLREVGDHSVRIEELTKDILYRIELRKARIKSARLIDVLSNNRNRIEETYIDKINLAGKLLLKAIDLLGFEDKKDA